MGPLDTQVLGLLCRVHRHYRRDNCAPLDRDQLVQDSGYTPSLVRAVLRSLEIRGFIETAQNNRRDLYHVTKKGWKKMKKSKKQKKLVVPDASARDGQMREFLYEQFAECEKNRSLLPHKISRHLIEKFDGQISDNTIRKYLHDWRHRDFS